MEIGLIDWFDEGRGFGVIKTPTSIDIFLHISNWKDSQKLTSENAIPLIFEIGFQRNKNTALNCVYFNPKDLKHWEKLFSLKEYSYGIKVGYSTKNLLELVFSNADENFEFAFVSDFIDSLLSNLSIDNLFNGYEYVYKLFRDTKNGNFKNDYLKLIASYINRQDNQTIFQFWQKNILPEYMPDSATLQFLYQEIGIKELKRIENNEIRESILQLKLNKLKNDFNSEDYVEFQDFIEIIDSEELRTSIATDLDKLANTNYLHSAKQEIERLTLNRNTTFYGLKQFISSQPTFLSNDLSVELMSFLSTCVKENCSFSLIKDFWQANYIQEIDDSILNRINSQSTEDLIYFLGSEKCDSNIAKPIFDCFFKRREFKVLLEQCLKFDANLFNGYNKLIFETADKSDYFELWRNETAKIIPLAFLSKYFNHEEERYLELKRWLNSKMISKEEAVGLLISNLSNNETIDDRFKFYRVFYSVKYLIDFDPDYHKKITPIKNDCVSLILWHLKECDNFDFESLKGKFIYFKPDDQVYIFKRLFYLKHRGQIDFDINKLDEIVRADVDLYLTNQKINGDFILDISTHIIIECLKSFIKTNNFIFESDLILKDLQRNSKKRFKIEKYFDACQGRQTANWNWSSEGDITQIFYGVDKFYYAISFVPGKEVEGENYYGTYTYFEKNFNFDYLKEQVKKLPNRNWKPEANHWAVPSNYKAEVYAFAKENRFFIDLKDKKHYDNNTHLVEFTRKLQAGKQISELKNIPNGITFCEGRKANKEHNTIKKEFWWCSNQECFQNCVVDHLSNEIDADNGRDIWEDYTLFDFLNILKINIDENNGIELVIDGHYQKFLGHINAFNRLLDRLYCDECKNLLYPVNSSHFALYRDVRFHCIDENCSQKYKEIYLNHCLYGECKTVIDSRISKRCVHGLFICPNCGTCCSEDSFKRRLESLKKVGGYIHPELIENVEKQNGHLEKKEYYCYKCAGMMTELDENTFKCSKCNVIYNLDKFKWLKKKWIEKHRRRKDYPVHTN